MIDRTAAQSLLRLARGFSIVALTGPRQSGKTTLARATFPDKPYLSLEDPDVRLLASADPRGLLSRYPDGAVLDEVQRAPDLFSYLQTRVDADPRPGLFVVTGSQQFGLLSQLTQSLAGRVGMVQLLPFSLAELTAADHVAADLDSLLARGCYPPLYDRDVSPGDWLASYTATYLERDVRQLVAVRDLVTFQRFLRLAAGRTGQLLNLSAMGADCGITHNTAAAWLAVLEASFVVVLLRPHHRNFRKRLVKTPKLYFWDTGLAAWLLGIRDAGHLETHPQRGALFETLVVTECLKARLNRGLPPDLWFWRDSRGLEVDLLAEDGDRLHPVEIKAGQTVAPDAFETLTRWRTLAGATDSPASLVYGGDAAFTHAGVDVVPWRQLPGLAAGSFSPPALSRAP